MEGWEKKASLEDLRALWLASIGHKPVTSLLPFFAAQVFGIFVVTVVLKTTGVSSGNKMANCLERGNLDL